MRCQERTLFLDKFFKKLPGIGFKVIAVHHDQFSVWQHLGHFPDRIHRDQGIIFPGHDQGRCLYPFCFTDRAVQGGLDKGPGCHFVFPVGILVGNGKITRVGLLRIHSGKGTGMGDYRRIMRRQPQGIPNQIIGTVT